MRRITPFLPLLLTVFSACTEEPCPTGQTRIGAACVDNFPDSGIADANTMDSNVADTPAIDTGNDAMIDACMPSAETCNGVSDDCDDIVDEGSCDFPNTSATCEPGGCVVSACDEGFLDCSEGMGCETASDRNNCGACGTVCGATEGCEAGVCVEHTLDWWWTVEGTDVLISSGDNQRYLLSKPTRSSVVLRPSTGGLTSLGGQADPFSFLVAIDESGARLWEVFIDADELDISVITTIEGADGVYIAGSFQGTLRADRAENQPAEQLDSSGTDDDGFVLRVDPAGNVQALAHLTDPEGSDTSQSVVDLAATSKGRVYLVGSSWGELATRVGGPAVLSGGHSGFLHRVGGTTVSTPNVRWESVTTDGENVYVGARLEETVMLGGFEFSTGDLFQPLVASYDAALAFRWAQAPLEATGGSGEDFPLYVRASNGSVVVSHNYDTAHSFGGFPVAAGPYIAALSARDGGVAWARDVETTKPPLISATGDRVYFAGVGVGDVDLGGGSLGPAVGGDALLGVLRSSGAYRSARRFGGLDGDTATGVQATPIGVMVSGSWSGVMNVDGEMFEASDPSEAFVFHFSPNE